MRTSHRGRAPAAKSGHAGPDPQEYLLNEGPDCRRLLATSQVARVNNKKPTDPMTRGFGRIHPIEASRRPHFSTYRLKGAFIEPPAPFSRGLRLLNFDANCFGYRVLLISPQLASPTRDSAMHGCARNPCPCTISFLYVRTGGPGNPAITPTQDSKCALGISNPCCSPPFWYSGVSSRGHLLLTPVFYTYHTHWMVSSDNACRC